MRRRNSFAVVLIALVAGALSPAAASAKKSIVVKVGAARIVVAIATTSTLKASQKPKQAKVKMGAKTYELTKVAGMPRTFAGKKVTPQGTLLALAGKKALVKIRRSAARSSR
jgi:hypothetical protein